MVVAADRSNRVVNDLEISQSKFELFVKNEADTAQLAALFSNFLKTGDVIFLEGVLASGKTFFVRKVVESLGTDDEISSPTYTIANFYSCTLNDVLHVDAYRLKDGQDFHNLGLETEVEGSICLIEWGSRVKDAFDDFLKVFIKLVPKKPSEREIIITAHGARATNLLNHLKMQYKTE